MLVLGIFLSILAVGFFCWLLFQLAVYAFPFFIAMTIGFGAYHHDAGILVSLLLSLLAGAATLAAGQIAFGCLASNLLRVAIALLFAVPAAWAGYAAAVGFAHLETPSPFWCDVLGLLGAVAAGATALLRLTAHLPEISGPSHHSRAPMAFARR